MGISQEDAGKATFHLGSSIAILKIGATFGQKSALLGNLAKTSFTPTFPTPWTKKHLKSYELGFLPRAGEPAHGVHPERLGQR